MRGGGWWAHRLLLQTTRRSLQEAGLERDYAAWRTLMSTIGEVTMGPR